MFDTDLHDESHLKILRVLETNPDINQRELAAAVGISLGKVNLCLKALMESGFVKAQNFRNNQNKLSYYYLLTPSGVAAKEEITALLLKRKLAEYDALKSEIEALKADMAELPANAQSKTH
jgi:EPS-associated MarR family transcriptional regulator